MLRIPKVVSTLASIGLLAHAAPTYAQSSAVDTSTTADSGATEPAQAARDGNSGAGLEEILITGSYIPRKTQLDQPTPIAIISSGQINDIGAKRISDITRTLTINTGAENNVDAFTQNATEGTSNVNLRGLGVGSTLVLLNGHRQTVAGTQNNQGVAFVDTAALIPLIAIDQVEVLKDGAAALYGSDAVAGVVNFKTRSNFSGAEVSVDYQTLTNGGKGQLLVQGIHGIQFEDRGGMVAAISYLRQEQLTTEDRRLSAFGIDDVSALGGPGTFFFFGIPDGMGGTLAPTPIIDPGCAAQGGIPAVAVPNALGPGLDAGTCNFDFGRYYQIVPKEERINAYFESNYRLFESVNWHSEFTFAMNDASRLQSPSFPILTFPTVPSDHPNDPFPDAFDAFPRAFFGRLIGYDGPAAVQNSNSVTLRASTGFDGKIGDKVSYDLNYAFSRNDRVYSALDQLGTRVTLGLNGLGGPGCDPLTGTPGVGPCQYLNPYSSSRTTAPNSPELLDWMTARQINDTTADLHVVDLVLTSPLYESDDLTIAAAAGWQYRRARQTTDWNDQSNDEDFVFILGNQDFDGVIEVSAAFVEASVDIFDRINLQVAGRYEGYFGGFGSTFDPKVAARVKIIDQIALRGSFSTSFKAPGIFQAFGGGTSLQQVTDPLNGATAFAAVTSSGNPDLDPEQSVNFNIGTTIQPVDGLNIDFDFWSFDFSDVITQENPQAKVNNNPQNPDVVVRAGSDTGPILRVLVDFVNATSVVTRGMDLTAQYRISTPVGYVIPSLSGTYILTYDIDDPNVGNIDGAGRLNFENFGTSTPRLRFNAGLAWLYDEHTLNVFVRHVGSYEDVQVRRTAPDGTVPTVDIDAFTTLDAQYRFAIDGLFSATDSLSLTIGGINLLDQDPPRVAINGGYDSKAADPRGRTLYGALTVGF